MQRLQKILLSVGILALLVIVISLGVSALVKPNQQTPVKKLITSPVKQKSTPAVTGIQTFAAWIWKYPSEIENADSMIDFSVEEGINTLYLNIDEYIDIYEMPDGDEKTQRLDKYINSIRLIISAAKEKGIKVHALSGNTTYSYDSHAYIPPILIAYVFDFNKRFPDTKFEGIQFDVEFYEDPRYFNSRDEYVNRYLKFVSDSVAQTKSLNETNEETLRLGFVIPFWFDQSNEYLKKPILNDVLSTLSTISGSYLVVMSYRNTIDDRGGVLDISETELTEANKTPVKIIIAQELKENKDAKITLYGRSKEEIKKDFVKIIDSAKVNSSFEGLSVHDLSAFMETI